MFLCNIGKITLKHVGCRDKYINYKGKLKVKTKHVYKVLKQALFIMTGYIYARSLSAFLSKNVLI